MNKVKEFWPSILIGLIVLLFFFPIFKGDIPFPGDLLVNTNPYSAEVYQGYNPGTYPNKAQGPDVIHEIYPWRYFSIGELKEGRLPFWNPHNFSGNPQLANFQTAVFYPFNFFYFLLPFNASWTLLIMLQPFLAGIFMYLFLKKGLELEKFPSFLGGVSFAFCSYMTVWIEYANIGQTLLWLPLVLLFTKEIFKKVSVANFLGIVIPLCFSLLGGYIQGFFYIYLIAFLYYYFLILSSDRKLRSTKKNIIFLVSLAIPVMITAFQLIPTISLFLQSTRGDYGLVQIEKNLSPLVNLITIFFPDFFGNPATRNYWLDGTYIERVLYPGTVMLFFALYSLSQKVEVKEKKFFFGVSVVSLIIATNFPFVEYFYLIPLPVISTTVATRVFSVFIFSLIVLGAIGVDRFLKEKNVNKKFVFANLGFYVGVAAFVFLYEKLNPSLVVNLKVTERNLIIPLVVLFLVSLSVFLKKKNIKATMLLLALLVVFDLFYFFTKITPFSPSSFTYPDTPLTSYIKKEADINRVWGYGSAYIPPNLESVNGTYSPEGNDPLHIATYGELLSSSGNGRLPEILPRPDANIAPGYGTDDLKNNYTRKKILDLLGVKYIIHKVELVDAWSNPDLSTFPETDYKLIKKYYPWQVYENLDVVPRFFVTGDYIIAKDKKETLSIIYHPNTNLSETVILNVKPDISIDREAKGKAKLISYKPDNVQIETDTTGNSLLFLSDNYFGSWKVKIDGNPSSILLADYTFRAVAVPKGVHKVEFYYESKNFRVGLITSLVGIIAAGLVTFYVRKTKKI